jgi:phospholipid/cholesterol/gamma-HCH transport system substrate-binding protein
VRRALAAAAAAAASVTLAGCQFTGFGSLPLPLTSGTGPGSYTVTAELADATHLPPHSEVMVGDVDVGTVTAVRFAGWHADLTLSLPGSVKLPANVTASIGQKSILGALYVSLAPPANARPAGTLAPGAVIPLSRTSTAPSTEDVLSVLSTVLNGGGLNQLSTITRELNNALAGHSAQLRDLLSNVRVLAGTLDAQRGTIVAAIANLNDLAARLRRQDATIAGALDQVPAGITVLARDEGKLNAALVAVSKLSVVADQVVNSSSANLLANLRNLQPIAARLADSGQNLIGALNVLPTYPFPVPAVLAGEKGDYGNLVLTLDLTLPDLEKLWLAGSPLAGLASGGTKATPARNPLTNPLKNITGTLIPNGSGSGSAGGSPAGGSPVPSSGPGGSSVIGGILGALTGGGS